MRDKVSVCKFVRGSKADSLFQISRVDYIRKNEYFYDYRHSERSWTNTIVETICAVFQLMRFL